MKGYVVLDQQEQLIKKNKKKTRKQVTTKKMDTKKEIRERIQEFTEKALYNE